MNDLSDLRNIYGSVFVLQLPDGLNIPWKPLSIQEFQEYSSLLESARTSQFRVSIENEIFQKSVTDAAIRKNLHKHKAGTVTSTVDVILAYSGPTGVKELNETLDLYRKISSSVLHDLVTTICTAFPAYKPEEVYSMDYNTFMLRAAMAERKLLAVGGLSGPIEFGTEDSAPKSQKKPTRKLKYDPEKLQEEYNRQTRQAPGSEEEDIIPQERGTKPGETYVVPADLMNMRTAAGADMEDLFLFEHQLKAEAQEIYKDYIEQMKSGNKIKIKSVDERMEDAQTRMKSNKEKLKSLRSQQKK